MRVLHGALVACLIVAVLGCAAPARDLQATAQGPSGETIGRHYAESLLAVSETGMYSVELLVLGGKLLQGENSAELIVHDHAGAEVMGATIEVIPWMPDMGHASADRPVITERGGGLYSAEQIRLPMGGKWELRVKISGTGGDDTAVFRFDNVAQAEHHAKPGKQQHHAERPEQLDTTAVALTAARAFRVSYQPRPDGRIPLNRVHQWSVRIETADGAPVTDAKLVLEGSMPEHGHGMPTKPRVTKNLGDGSYLVDGVKFQMPGWWVVSLRVSSGGTTDTATFNLDLR